MDSGRFLVALCAALLCAACPTDPGLPDGGDGGGAPQADAGDAGDGAPDASFDAGRADAGDAGRPDAGTPDAGPVVDAGPYDAGPRFVAQLVDGGAPIPAAPSFDGFVAQVGAAFCARGQQCGTFQGGQRFADACEFHFTQILKDQFLGASNSVLDGRLVYDVDAGQACLARFFGNPFDCGNVTVAQFARCDGVLRGVVGDAGRCLHEDECVDPEFQCVASEICQGACLAVGMEGQPCPRNGACHPTLFCQLDAGFEGTCVKKKGQGELCFAEDECDTTKGICKQGSCALLPTEFEPCLDGFCAAGHRCDFFFRPEVCRKYPAQNQPCSTLNPCDPQAMFCFDNGATLTCQPRRGNNEVCPSSDACLPGLYCEDELCRPKLPAGSACEGDDACGDLDNQCDEVLRSCIVPERRFLGETCTSDSQFCDDGLFCRGTRVNLSGAVGDAGFCDRYGEGDLCPRKGVCPEFTTCELDAGINDAGRRIPPRCVPTGVGSVCIDNFECPEDFYCDRSIADRGCQPRKNAGVLCDPFLDTCESGLFCVPTPDAKGFACGQLPQFGELCHRVPPGSGCVRPLKCEPNVDGGFGRCIAGGMLGEPCDEDCFEGACRADGGVRVCIPPRLDGFPCSRGSECGSGVCDPNTGRCRSACF